MGTIEALKLSSRNDLDLYSCLVFSRFEQKSGLEIWRILASLGSVLDDLADLVLIAGDQNMCPDRNSILEAKFENASDRLFGNIAARDLVVDRHRMRRRSCETHSADGHCHIFLQLTSCHLGSIDWRCEANDSTRQHWQPGVYTTGLTALLDEAEEIEARLVDTGSTGEQQALYRAWAAVEGEDDRLVDREDRVEDAFVECMRVIVRACED